MHKRSIIFIAIIVLLFIATLVYIIPYSSAVPQTLNAVKVDAQGNVIEAVEISVQGKLKTYLFREDRLDIYIPAFDGFNWIKLSENQPSGVEGKLVDAPENDIRYTALAGYKDNDVHFLTLGFSPDLDSWILVDSTENVFYVACVSGKYTTQELITYFRALIPSIWGTTE